MKRNKQAKKKKTQKQRGKFHRRGQRYTQEQQEKALEMLRQGETYSEISKAIGPSPETLRLWKNRAGLSKPAPSSNDSRPAPLLTPGGLSKVEVDEILEMKRKHPSYGPEQIQAQLRRFKGWRISRKAIGKVLKDHGYELVHVASRPQGNEEPHRWEAPHRSAVWQMDLTELRVGPDKRALAALMDDFSRYVVGWGVFEAPTGEKMVEVMKEAIRKHGKPEAVYTDRGGVFLDWGKETSFQRLLADELIDHIVGRPYHPQGRGKIEALFKTIRRELWDVRHFESWEEAIAALAEWFQAYNTRRAHMGIDGLTPADRFFGRWDEVRARIEAAARGRLAAGTPASNLFEEEAAGCGVEVLRLMAVDDNLELRFLGHRIRLGTLDK
jgi:putative transposase